jgi:CheY-like chemotaxis protein
LKFVTVHGVDVMSHALIVDDNKQNLKVLGQLLSKQGVKHTAVPDIETLLTLIPSLGEVDVVFLDLELPGLDGYQAKDLIKSKLGNVPVIAYTIHTSEINVVRQLGFDGFLGKPVDSARFPEYLSRILQGEAIWERI